MSSVFKTNKKKFIRRLSNYAKPFHVKFVTTNISCYRISDHERDPNFMYKKDVYGVYLSVVYLNSMLNFFHHKTSSKNITVLISRSMFAKLSY